MTATGVTVTAMIILMVMAARVSVVATVNIHVDVDGDIIDGNDGSEIRTNILENFDVMLRKYAEANDDGSNDVIATLRDRLESFLRRYKADQATAALFNTRSNSETGAPSSPAGTLNSYQHRYCIIGAGPGGLQMGYFLKKMKRDFVIIERKPRAGSFFEKYPIHRRLISINKFRFGWKTTRNASSAGAIKQPQRWKDMTQEDFDEYSFRHDWNSLINDEKLLRVNQYSGEYFPHADAYVQYLRDFARHYSLNIHYNTTVGRVMHEKRDVRDIASSLDNSNNDKKERKVLLEAKQAISGIDIDYECNVVIFATGIEKPHIPETIVKGRELLTLYRNVDRDPAAWKDKFVMIIGKGNSGFETADAIMGAAAEVTMISRHTPKHAWATHYVGDLRAVNNNAIDTYQLKSSTVLMDGKFAKDTQFEIVRLTEDENSEKLQGPNLFLRVKGSDHVKFGPYDHIVLATGFQMTPYVSSYIKRGRRKRWRDISKAIRDSSTNTKFPKLRKDIPFALNLRGTRTSVGNIYSAGVLMHSLDYKKSSGGFIHGFRYLIRALHRTLEWKYEGLRWPSERVKNIHGLGKHILKRVGATSGLYQMFGQEGLVDLFVVIRRQNRTQQIEHFQEIPYKYTHSFLNQFWLSIPTKARKGIKSLHVLALSLEYGRCYKADSVFTRHRFCSMKDHDCMRFSNFLHPVLRLFRLTLKDRTHKLMQKLPKHLREFHLSEDVFTRWSSDDPDVYLNPLNAFLEVCSNVVVASRKRAREINVVAGEVPVHELKLIHSKNHQSCLPEILSNNLLDKYLSLSEEQGSDEGVLQQRLLNASISWNPNILTRNQKYLDAFKHLNGG